MSTSPVMDGGTLQLGLLLDTAAKHQAVLDTHLQGLQQHVQQLEGVVREEVRRAAVDEFACLIHESTAAAAALRALGRSVRVRMLLWSSLMLLLPALLASVALVWLLPSSSELRTLRAQEQQLRMRIEQLRQAGSDVQLQRCGQRARLCARIDTGAPAYGAQSDYRILSGY